MHHSAFPHDHKNTAAAATLAEFGRYQINTHQQCYKAANSFTVSASVILGPREHPDTPRWTAASSLFSAPRTPCSDGHLDDVSSPPLSSGGEEGFEPLARSNNVKPRFKELLSLPLHPTPQAGWRTSAWCHLVPAPHWKLLYLYTLKCYSYIAGE